jgi:hypothetical protein
MRQELIFAPMGALVLWTSLILTVIPFMRGIAVARRTIANHDFKRGESERVPAFAAIPNRNYMNLLEFPMLFYVLCVAIYAAHAVDRTALLMAWTYVGLRVAHSLMHLTFNVVGIRAVIFAASSITATVMWVLFLIKEFPGGWATVFNF